MTFEGIKTQVLRAPVFFVGAKAGKDANSLKNLDNFC